ncbi:MAG: hypothetical protein R6X15_10800, partial [Pseudomonadota bacterium]
MVVCRYIQVTILCFAMTATLLLQGCSPTPRIEKPVSEETSLVFGHLDMKDAPSRLDWIAMKMLQPVTDRPYVRFWVVDGTFFAGHVPLGTYKFDSFGGGSDRYRF